MTAIAFLGLGNMGAPTWSRPGTTLPASIP
jgi:hypothetical protein